MAAEHRGAAARNDPPEQPIIIGHDRARQLCLDAGRALVLCGVLVAIPAAFGPGHGAAANTNNSTRALLGYVLWITGVTLCILALTPAAPRAARAGAAVAVAVLSCLSPLVN